MIKDIKALSETDTLEDACKMMRQYNIGIVPVLKNNICVNLMTDRDIVLLLSKEFVNKKLYDLNAKNVITVNQNDSILKVYELMSYYQIKRVIVNNDIGRMVGIISLSDIILTCRDFRSLETVLEIKKRLVNNSSCPSNDVKVDDFPL